MRRAYRSDRGVCVVVVSGCCVFSAAVFACVFKCLSVCACVCMYLNECVLCGRIKMC